MIDKLVESEDIPLFEEMKSTNSEISVIEGIIKKREEKGKYAYTDVLIPYLEIMSVYYLYVKTRKEKYKIYVTDKFNALINDLNYLRYEFCINNDFGIELLSNINLNDITYLKQRASLLVALDFYKKCRVLDITTKRDLFKNASFISDEEKELTKRECNAYSDALVCLAWVLEKMWQEALRVNDIAKKEEIREEEKKYRELAYDLGHPIAAIEKAKSCESPTDNERCQNYLKGALGSIDGIRFLESNKHDIYDFWAYKDLLVERSVFYDAYVEKTDDFYLLSKCAKIACSDRYAQKISSLILSNDDFSYLWITDLIDIKKRLYFRKDEYNEAYKKVLNYLCEKGNKNSIYEKILDEIDEGINVEENFEKLYSFRDEEARVLYDYRKNRRWNTYYFSSKFCEEAYPTCFREFQRGRPKDVETFYNGGFGIHSLDTVKK